MSKKSRRASKHDPHRLQEAAASLPLTTSREFTFLRVWLVAMFAATLWTTWPLWSDRAEPPRLPLVDGPDLPYCGVWMLLSAAAYLYWPRAGLTAFVITSSAAMVADQTRMQPQMFSFWLLMLGTLPSASARLLGRCHLSSLWFFSGFHKLLSAGYFSDVAPFLWRGIVPAGAEAFWTDGAKPAAAAIAIVELTLGLAMWVPRLRRFVAVGGALVHLGVVTVLYRLDWNTSVWGWNLALAAASLVFIYPWRGTIGDERRRSGSRAFAIACALWLSPLLYYAGLLDAYLSHCLYSSNVPTATMLPAGGVPYQINDPYWKNLNVPQPPAHRLFEEYFRRVSKPGDAMIVRDGRRWAAWAGWDFYQWRRAGASVEQWRLPPPPKSPD